MMEETTTNVSTPNVPETEITPEVQEDVAKQELSTQPTSEADVEEGASKEVVSSPTSDWENEKKSMSGKIQQLEKERNELAQSKALLEAIDKAATDDPEYLKLTARKLAEQGIIDESVLQQFESSPSLSQANGMAKNPAIEWAESKMREEKQKREEFFVNFEDKHPDLVEGEEKVVRANRSAIGAIAAKKMASEQIPMNEAYEYAYKLVMNPSLLVEEGKLQGLAQAQSATPVESGASGSSSNPSGGVKLTPEKSKIAVKFGIKE